MGLVSSGVKFWKDSKINKKKDPKSELLEYLEKLRRLESRLWGVTINDLSNGEESMLEDTNHLIHMINHRKEEDANSKLKVKEVREFLDDVKKLQKDFNSLKNMARAKDRLRKHISEYTIRLVNSKNFNKMKDIILLENQLYEVLDVQDELIKGLIREVSGFRFDTEQRKLEVFLETLYQLRTILAGHIEYHQLWEEERMGYSNASNIIRALKREVQEEI